MGKYKKRNPKAKMDSNAIIGVAVSVCTVVSLLPQLIKIIKEEEPSDIFLLGVFNFDKRVNIVGKYYGAMPGDLAIIISNAVLLCINLTVLTFNVYYQKKTPL